MNAAAEEDDDDCLSCCCGGGGGVAVPGAAAAAEDCPAVGCVGWRFHHDSLGSHACLHLCGPKKTKQKNPKLQQQRDPAKADDYKTALRGRVELLNLL